MNRSPITLTALAAGCVAIGAAGSTIVAASAESPSTPKSATAAKAPKAGTKAKISRAAVERAARRAVHAEITVATKDGFDEVVVDRGVVTAVSGDELTVQHKTKKLTGDTVTVKIPADAKVRVDRKEAKLIDVKQGQRVAVLQLPKRTVVRAMTPKP